MGGNRSIPNQPEKQTTSQSVPSFAHYEELVHMCRHWTLTDLGVIAKSQGDGNAVILLGNTGTGKSSLCNFLCGVRMQCDKDPARVRTYVMEQGGFAVSNSTNHACTKSAKCMKAGKLVIWDTPGFNDTEGLKGNVTRALMIKEILLRHQTARLVLLTRKSELCRGSSGTIREMVRTVVRTFESGDDRSPTDHQKLVMSVCAGTMWAINGLDGAPELPTIQLAHTIDLVEVNQLKRNIHVMDVVDYIGSPDEKRRLEAGRHLDAIGALTEIGCGCLSPLVALTKPESESLRTLLLRANQELKDSGGIPTDGMDTPESMVAHAEVLMHDWFVLRVLERILDSDDKVSTAAYAQIQGAIGESANDLVAGLSEVKGWTKDAATRFCSFVMCLANGGTMQYDSKEVASKVVAATGLHWEEIKGVMASLRSGAAIGAIVGCVVEGATMVGVGALGGPAGIGVALISEVVALAGAIGGLVHNIGSASSRVAGELRGSCVEAEAYIKQYKRKFHHYKPRGGRNY
eukprot:197497-Amorphochlora_amoeboformis.AAC.1